MPSKDPSFAAIPTYPVVLALKGDGKDVNLFSETIKGRPIPGMPPLNPNRVVCLLRFSYVSID
jgi:peroxisomal enoyl-CoA hydratase 2